MVVSLKFMALLAPFTCKYRSTFTRSWRERDINCAFSTSVHNGIAKFYTFCTSDWLVEWTPRSPWFDPNRDVQPYFFFSWWPNGPAVISSSSCWQQVTTRYSTRERCEWLWKLYIYSWRLPRSRASLSKETDPKEKFLCLWTLSATPNVHCCRPRR